MRSASEIVAAVKAKQASRVSAAGAAELGSGNPPALELAIVGLEIAANALEELAALEHDGPCRCGEHLQTGGLCRRCEAEHLAEDADSIHWQLRLLTSVLDSQACGLS